MLGYVPFDDASVQGAFTPKLEAGVRAVQKKEQKTNSAFKVDGHGSVKTQDAIQKSLQAHALKRNLAWRRTLHQLRLSRRLCILCDL